MKRRIKRPPLHYLIVAGYVVSPIVNLLLLALFVDLPLSLIINGLPRAYGPLIFGWLVTAPLVGLGLLLLNRLSWYVFLAHGALVIVDFLVRTVFRAGEYLAGQNPLHTALLAAGNMVLVAIIAYVLQRDFRAPYLHVLSRAFREHTRVPIRRTLTVAGVAAVTSDFSAGGCFIPAAESPDATPGIDVGQRLPLTFTVQNLDLSCEGEVMRVQTSGYGLRFIGLSRPSRRAVAAFVRNHYALRYAINAPAQWRHGEQETHCTAVNISKGGCYLAASPPSAGEGFAEGQIGTLVLNLPGAQATTLRAQLAWVNAAAQFDKPAGFGVHFATSQRRLVRQLLRETRAVLVR